MKPNNYYSKSQLDEIGGMAGLQSADSSASIAVTPGSSEDDDEAEDTGLYSLATPTAPHRKYSARSLCNRLKARQTAEQRLVRLSEELQKLANEIRYLNPLMAEAIDDAWDSTEAALEMLATDELW